MRPEGAVSRGGCTPTHSFESEGPGSSAEGRPSAAWPRHQLCPLAASPATSTSLSEWLLPSVETRVYLFPRFTLGLSQCGPGDSASRVRQHRQEGCPLAPGSRTGCCTVPAHRCEWPEEKPQRRPRRQAPSPGPGSASEVPCPPGKWQFKALTKWGQLLPKKTIRLCSPQVGPTCAQALNARLFPVLFIRGTVPLLFFSHLHAPRTAAWPATGRPLSSFMNHTRACATHVNPTASSKKDRNPLEGPTPNANHCVRHCAGTGPCPQDH